MKFTNSKLFISIISLAIATVFIFLLAYVFPGYVILPQGFSIGFLHVRFYGICLALAALAGWVLAQKRVSAYGRNSQDAENIFLTIILTGFIGARLYHVLSSFSFYAAHPVQVFAVWQGGLSIYGALLGGVFGVWLYLRLKKQSGQLFSMLDWLAPSLALGQMIGRFGNFFNYELFGYPTNLPWKMFVPENFRPLQFAESAYFHPLFLYESILSGLIVLLLLRLSPTLKHKSGALFFVYVLLYNIARFFLEFLRIDSVFYRGVRVNAQVSLVMAVIALAALVYMTRKMVKK